MKYVTASVCVLLSSAGVAFLFHATDWALLASLFSILCVPATIVGWWRMTHWRAPVYLISSEFVGVRDPGAGDTFIPRNDLRGFALRPNGVRIAGRNALQHLFVPREVEGYAQLIDELRCLGLAETAPRSYLAWLAALAALAAYGGVLLAILWAQQPWIARAAALAALLMMLCFAGIVVRNFGWNGRRLRGVAALWSTSYCISLPHLALPLPAALLGLLLAASLFAATFLHPRRLRPSDCS